METTLFMLLACACLVGVVLAALQLPGTWLILLCAVGYDWRHDWQSIGWRWMLLMLVLAAIAEAADTLATIVAARRAGASRRASVGALVGGFAGMFFLSIPAPLIGTIIGGLIGCFLGAVLAEWTKRNDVAAGVRVGLFATIGRALGLAAKTSAALVIAGVTMILAARATWSG